VDPEVMDKIMASPRAKEVLANPPEEPTLDDIKKQYGTEDEDELIYRAFLPDADVAKMRAAGPIKTSYPLLSTPELEQVRKLMKIASMPVIEVKSSTLNMSLRRNA